MSTFMDDGGESNDSVMVHSTEMVDNQSDELEIPTNTKTKRQGKKLQNESEGAIQIMCRNNKRRYDSLSSSTRLPLPPQLKRCGNRLRLKRPEKRKNSMLVDKESPCNRRWEDMDHEILIQIMKRYSLYDWGCTYFVVCKSWLSAFLDFLFPPGHVLDLRVFDDNEKVMCKYRLRRSYHYLKLNLNRRSPDSYTMIILSNHILPNKVYKNIAQRLPLLKSFVFPEKMIHMRMPPNPNSYKGYDEHYGIAMNIVHLCKIWKVYVVILACCYLLQDVANLFEV